MPESSLYKELLLTDEEMKEYCKEVCGHIADFSSLDHCTVGDYGVCNRQAQIHKLSKLGFGRMVKCDDEFSPRIFILLKDELEDK
jgi:hypothetical protein